MTRTLIAALRLMGLSLVARIVALPVVPTPFVGLAIFAAGPIGTIVFLGALARAAWMRRPIPWSQGHRLGAVGGGVLFGLSVLWYPGFSSGEGNLIVPEGDFLEVALRSATLQDGWWRYVPESSVTKFLGLTVRLVFDTVYGAILGTGLGEMLISLRRWGAR